MHQAFRLAREGWGKVHPNPLVGAVVARGATLVSGGRHLEFGGPHAEVDALTAAAGHAAGATLYVTLEPCTHLGKQPPCTDAIIAAGIARVVIAARDPNPEAAGGVERLRAAGITVDVGIDGPPFPDRNFRFVHRFKGLKRPYVAIKLAVSMDGMIADATGNSRWVSADGAREWVHWLRSGFGAIAVGARTAIADQARLTARGPVQPRTPPVRVVFDRSGTLTPEHSVLNDAHSAPVIVVTGKGVVTARRTMLAETGADVLGADTLEDALELLTDRGIDSLLVEGGGRLAGSLFREGLVDRIYQVQSPRWLGDGTSAWSGLGERRLEDSQRWRVINVEQLSGADDTTDVLIEMER